MNNVFGIYVKTTKSLVCEKGEFREYDKIRVKAATSSQGEKIYEGVLIDVDDRENAISLETDAGDGKFLARISMENIEDISPAA